MRKIRKRVFAAVLAAVLLFTMPGTASAAAAEEAQTEDISESVTAQTEEEAAEEKTVPIQKEGSSEENKEDAEQGDTGERDASTNLCVHHKEHTKDCGYSRASEDGEGSPCTYECRLCPIGNLLAVLPRRVTEDNRAEVETQLDEILNLYRKLTKEEQEQIDISRCLELQEALDAAYTPAFIDGPNEGDVAQVETDGNISCYSTIDDAWTAAKGKTATVTLLTDVTASGTLTVDEGGTVTFVGGGYTLTSGQQTAIQVNGTLKLVSGTVRSTYSGFSSSGKGGIDVNGTLEMTGGVVTTSESMMSAAVAVRADSNGNITVSGGKISGCYGICIKGTVMVRNGEISGKFSAVDVKGGTATIEGGTFTGSSFYGLNIASGTVVLRGGTFTGGDYAIRSPDDISALLDKTKQPSACYAYFENNQPVNLANLEDPNQLPGGTYTVQECIHSGVKASPDDNGAHSLECPYCGYIGPVEDCDYGAGYRHNDTSHIQTCTVCGYEKVEAHTLKLTARANGTVITASDACDCGYQKDLGAVTLTVPANLTYNDGQEIGWEAGDLAIANGMISAGWRREYSITGGKI